MALMSPAQIKEALAYRAALIAIQNSYDALKVSTTIQKPNTEGEPVSYYNANDLLQDLKESVDNLSQGNIENETITDEEIASIFADN